MEDKRTYRRGEVYFADLDPRTGSEQGGIRPVLVLQNNAGNYFCPTLIVAPLTTNLSKKPKQPTHRFVDGGGALRPSLVMLEQITTIDKSRVKKYIGRLRREKMREIDDAVEISLGLRIPEDTPAP